MTALEGAYRSVVRTNDRVQTGEILAELAAANPHLSVIVPGLTSWTGLRVFDHLGTDRRGDLPKLAAMVDGLFGRKNVDMINVFNLAAGSAQHEHRDQAGNLLFGIMRVHIALKTNPEAMLMIERTPYHFGLGEVWAIDTSGRHAARNGGVEDRVHLVVDVRRSAQTAHLFPVMTTSVIAHLARFVVVMAGKAVRDAVVRPRSLLARLPHLAQMILRRPADQSRLGPAGH